MCWELSAPHTDPQVPTAESHSTCQRLGCIMENKMMQHGLVAQTHHVRDGHSASLCVSSRCVQLCSPTHTQTGTHTHSFSFCFSLFLSLSLSLSFSLFFCFWLSVFLSFLLSLLLSFSFSLFLSFAFSLFLFFSSLVHSLSPSLSLALSLSLAFFQQLLQTLETHRPLRQGVTSQIHYFEAWTCIP